MRDLYPETAIGQYAGIHPGSVPPSATNGFRERFARDGAG